MHCGLLGIAACMVLLGDLPGALVFPFFALADMYECLGSSLVSMGAWFAWGSPAWASAFGDSGRVLETGSDLLRLCSGADETDRSSTSTRAAQQCRHPASNKRHQHQPDKETKTCCCQPWCVVGVRDRKIRGALASALITAAAGFFGASGTSKLPCDDSTFEEDCADT